MAKAGRLYTVPQTAKALGIGTRTAWRLIAAGKVPTVKIGGQRRIRGADLNTVLERGTESGQLAAEG